MRVPKLTQARVDQWKADFPRDPERVRREVSAFFESIRPGLEQIAEVWTRLLEAHRAAVAADSRRRVEWAAWSAVVAKQWISSLKLNVSDEDFLDHLC